MRQTIVKQFQRPTGLLGRLASWIMAHRESNIRRSEWVVSLLEIAPQRRMLELGCGPRLALEHATRLAREGQVVGLDPSALMVNAARKRNAGAVQAGRVGVIHGTAERAADPAERFDRVLAVNVLQFWDAPAKILCAIRELMTPDGVIGLAFQPRNKGASDDDAWQGAERNRKLLSEAGFRDLRIETLRLEPIVTCVLGRA
jgi:SAM-dependent methyltransferase